MKMRDPSRTLAAFYTVDELSRRHSPVHDRHPLALSATTAAFMVVIASFGRREVSTILPLFLYPCLTLALADVRPAELFRRLASVAPLILAIAALSPVFETAPVRVGPWTIAGGWLSFGSLVVKLTLTVTAAFLLVATAGMGGVARGLRAAGVPRLAVVVLQMTYRYVALLLAEVTTMTRAHELRSGGRRGVDRSVLGPMIGGLLLRSYDRAGRVYDAMSLRGFDGEYRVGQASRFGVPDTLYCLAWLGYFAIVRLVDLAEALGRIANRLAGGML